MARILEAITLVIIGMLMVLATSPRALGQKPTIMFPVALQVPVAPTPFKANGKTHLVYELHMTSFRAGELLLSRVEVYDDQLASKDPLARYTDAELNGRLTRPGPGGNLTDMRLIGAGMRAVAYLWLTFDATAIVPKVLRHRLYFK